MYRTGRAASSLLLALALAGCSGDPSETDSVDTDATVDTDVTGDDFVDQGEADSVEAGPTAVEYAVMLSLIIVVCLQENLDIPAVEDFLDSEGDGAGAEAPDGVCYTLPDDGDPLSITIDFSGCADEGTSGMATLKKVPAE
jgi:hypothetical protein